MAKIIILIAIGVLLVSRTAIAQDSAAAKDDAKHAGAVLESKSGSSVKGNVTFDEEGDSLKVGYKIDGLKPGAAHGFHIHDFGDCSAPDAKSAGAHYAEIASTGGTAVDSPAKHAGDLPQIKADAKGHAEGSFTVPRLSLDNQYQIAGRAIVVHGGPDDSTKKAPPRIACGAIKIMNPESVVK